MPQVADNRIINTRATSEVYYRGGIKRNVHMHVLPTTVKIFFFFFTVKLIFKVKTDRLNLFYFFKILDNGQKHIKQCIKANIKFLQVKKKTQTQRG